MNNYRQLKREFIKAVLDGTDEDRKKTCDELIFGFKRLLEVTVDDGTRSLVNNSLSTRKVLLMALEYRY